MRDMFLCFSGLAEQFHVLNQQLSCTETFSYRNGRLYRDGERQSDVCTADTHQPVTPAGRQFIGRAQLRIAPPSKYFANDEGRTIFRSILCAFSLYIGTHNLIMLDIINKQETL
jgi:hypothetical protein